MLNYWEYFGLWWWRALVATVPSVNIDAVMGNEGVSSLHFSECLGWTRGGLGTEYVNCYW
jgi:hypothetical protein